MIEPSAGQGFGDDHDGLLSRLRPYRLWSLWEMLQAYAIHYIELGRLIEEAQTNFTLCESCEPDEPEGEITDEEFAKIRDTLRKILREGRTLGLRTAAHVVAKAVDETPETGREFSLVIETVKGEIASKKFLYVPDYRAEYYQIDLSDAVEDAFPSASAEIIAAGRAFSVGLATACVFHAMRAAEIGVRALAKQLGGIIFSIDISLVEWAQVLDKIDARIREMKQLPRGTKKDEDLQFYSEAASQFRYFKDGWRVRVAHARATYSEQQALTVLDHTLSFFRRSLLAGSGSSRLRWNDLPKCSIERLFALIGLHFAGKLSEALVLRLILNLSARRFLSRLPRRSRFRRCHRTGAIIALAPYMARPTRAV